MLTDEMNKQSGVTRFIAEKLKAISGFFADQTKRLKENARLTEERVERENAIAKLLDDQRKKGGAFSQILRANENMLGLLRLRESAQLDLNRAEADGDTERAAQLKTDIEKQNAVIELVSNRIGKTEELIALWDKMTKAIQTARDAEAEETPESAKPKPKLNDDGKGPKGMSFQQLLAQLGDERAAVREEFAKAREDIITSEKVTDEERLELLKAAGVRRLEAMKEIADAEVEVVKEAEEDKAQIQRATNAVALSSAAAFGKSLSDVIRAGGKEQTDAGKAIFAAQQAISVASIIASTLEASGKAGAAVAGAGPAAWFASKTGIETLGFANAGIVAGLSVSNITGGGRQSGGPVSPGRVHPINENGDPEILVQGARQFLLPGSKGGDVISGASMRMSGGGAPSVTINNSGAPIEVVEQRITRDEVVLLVRNAENSAVGRVDSSLSSGRGSTSRALKTGFETQRNLS